MSNAVVKMDNRGMVLRYEDRISQLMPGLTSTERDSNAKRFLGGVLNAITSTPKLNECSSQTFVSAVVKCAELNMVPNTPQQLCWIIPYGATATLVMGWRGLAELAYRTGVVTHIQSEVVYQKEVDEDMFEIKRGVPTTIRHDSDMKRDEELRSGAMAYAYAYAIRRDSEIPVTAVISRVDIERAIKSSAAGTKGPWSSDPAEMWKKTAIKRLCKNLPQSEGLAAAIDLDNRQEEGIGQWDSSKPKDSSELLDEMISSATDIVDGEVVESHQ